MINFAFMILHVFNPEHDIALASNLEQFTAPGAARQLRYDLGFLPALWADEGEYVLVKDVDAALEGLNGAGLATNATLMGQDSFCKKMRDNPNMEIGVRPWGWDYALRHEMVGMGINPQWLPANAVLDDIRAMSHRSWAANNLLLPLRSVSGTVGESCQLGSAEEVRDFLTEKGRIVLKSPWSSSGRGIRFVPDAKADVAVDCQTITPQLEGWIKNVVARQGCVMAEPYYNKVCDFGMEFESRNGMIDYCGLSLFRTLNGAYAGNILDDECHKEATISGLLPRQMLDAVRTVVKDVLASTFKGKYQGRFGIDMMVVRKSDGSLALHPCVELNLRMTMGHVANLLANKHGLNGWVMRIAFSGGHYRLRIQ